MGDCRTQLELGGVDLRDSLWTATVLLEDPAAIGAAHLAFLDAGAEVLITAQLSGELRGLRRARLGCGGHGPGAGGERGDRAGGRSGPIRSPGAGRGARSAPTARCWPTVPSTVETTARRTPSSRDFHRRRTQILLDAGPDLLAIETIPSIAEAHALVEVLADLSDARAWFAFTCADGTTLADGTPFAEGVALVAASPQVSAVGVNCTAPEFVGALIRSAREVTAKPIVVYPNRGGAWDPVAKRWEGSQGRVGRTGVLLANGGRHPHRWLLRHRRERHRRVELGSGAAIRSSRQGRPLWLSEPARQLVRCFGDPLDRRKPGVPLRGQPLHPPGRFGEALGAHLEATFPPFAPAADEPHRVEHCQALDNRLTADGQLARERRRRGGTVDRRSLQWLASRRVEYASRPGGRPAHRWRYARSHRDWATSRF